MQPRPNAREANELPDAKWELGLQSRPNAREAKELPDARWELGAQLGLRFYYFILPAQFHLELDV